MRKDYIGTLYTGVSDAFQGGLYPIVRTIKASNHDLSVIEVINLSERVDVNVEQNTIPKRREEKRLGCLSNGTGGNFAGQVFDEDGLRPTLTDMQGGGRQPHIMEVQKLNDTKFVYGREADIERLSDAVKDEEQHLCKLNKMPQGALSSLDDAEICDIDAPVASTVTARYYKGIGAHKDTMVLQAKKVDAQTIEQQIVAMRGRNPDFYNFLYEIDGDIYLIRIRKLIPKECWKLMDFSDEDFEKAAAVNSNTQLYKQAGNSIVKNVLVAIMGQLFDGKEDVYRKL